MKKSLLAMLLAVALVAPVVAAEKNMWIGGSLGYQSVSATNSKGKSTDMNSLTIAPEFGYSLNEKWDIGLDLAYTTGKGYKSSVGALKTNIDVSSEPDVSDFSIAPFARYHVANIAGIDVMLKGSLLYGKTTYKGDSKEMNLTEFGIAIAPVVSYSINETWSIGATLNFLELGYYSLSDDDSDGKYSEFGFNVNDGSLISIGFSYHF